MKPNLQMLPSVGPTDVFAESAAPAASRVSDRPHPQTSSETVVTAEYLLERQAIVARTLRAEDSLSSVFTRQPPLPAALVMIQNPAVRERYLKVLHKARIETEGANDPRDASVKLSARVHALLFTDQIDLIRVVRQLNTGSATHAVFVCPDDSSLASQALQAGADDTMSEKAQGEQFWAHMSIARRILGLASSLQTAITDNRILSTLDELTRCGNRHYFEAQFSLEIARAVRLRRPLALLLCDIDHFKTFNDRYGHHVGDEVLREFGHRLTHDLRLGEDWVARIGGEEFAIVLSETGRIRGLAVAERLRERISERPFECSCGLVGVTASFGVCGVEAPSSHSDLREIMMRQADAALYQSKHQGRNRVTDAASLDSTKHSPGE